MNAAALLDMLLAYNPWWENSVGHAGIIREQYLTKILQYLKTKEIVVLNGVRRSGKTTLLYQTIRHLIAEGKNPRSILFVNCDEPLIHNQVSLDEILETYKRDVYGGDDITLVFDEIQSIDGWERRIKTWYDTKQYTILISGSTSSLLTSNLANLISGRYLKVTVYPLDFSEYLSFQSVEIPKDTLSLRAKRFELIEHLRHYLDEGGFPAVVSTQDTNIKKELITGYYDTIIFRDIERTYKIRNPKTLHEVIDYLLANISLPFSYSRIAKMLDSDVSTIKDYVSFAQEAYLMYELRTFSYSMRTQNASQKKIYAIDTGLRNSVSFRFSDDLGRLVENIVYLSLIRNNFESFFWKGKNEVDFVVKRSDYTLSAINVCYTDEIPEREIKGLVEFAEAFEGKVQRKILITKDTDKTEDGILYVPLYRWLLSGVKELE